MKKTHFSGDKKLLSYNPGWTERPDPPSSAPRKDVWGGWKIILSLSLEMKGGRRETVETGIQRARGVVVKYRRAEGNGEEEEDLGKVEGADVSVTRYRHGPAYLEVRSYYSYILCCVRLTCFNAGISGEQDNRNGFSTTLSLSSPSRTSLLTYVYSPSFTFYFFVLAHTNYHLHRKSRSQITLASPANTSRNSSSPWVPSSP